MDPCPAALTLPWGRCEIRSSMVSVGDEGQVKTFQRARMHDSRNGYGYFVPISAAQQFCCECRLRRCHLPYGKIDSAGVYETVGRAICTRCAGRGLHTSHLGGGRFHI